MSASSLFSSSVKNRRLGLIVAAVIFFVLGFGGSGALYGNYVQTASAQVRAASSAGV